MPSRDLATWLSYLESIHPANIELGLKRVQTVYARLALDFSQTKIILVAGTNGKGTTCHLLQNILSAHGSSVACFNSPHIHHYQERVTLNGQWFDEIVYCNAFEKVEQARAEIPLTYFEMGTLAALVMLAEAQTDYVVLEVGLGGRLDATNIVDPAISVITTIALDHMDWLGDTREKIGYEKAGIMRTDTPAVCFDLNPPHSISEHAQCVNASLSLATQDYQWQETNSDWSWSSQQQQYTQLPKPEMPIQNAAGVLMVLQRLSYKINESILRDVLMQFKLAGRWQTVHNKPDVIIDVGHNEQASAYILGKLANYKLNNPNADVYAVVGMLQDKAINEALVPFKGQIKHWFLGTIAGPRGAKSDYLHAALPAGEHSEQFNDIKSALAAALKQAQNEDLVLAFGSFYVVADVLESMETFNV